MPQAAKKAGLILPWGRKDASENEQYREKTCK